LILPVYYVECQVLSDEEKRAADSLAKVIGARQRADWRDLRFEPFTSPQVGKTFAAMAIQIHEAMDRGQPVRSASSVAPSIALSSKAPLQGVPTAARGQGETGLESVITTRGPVPKAEPHTRVVDALHRGDHSTLTEALSAAKPGDRILIRPGLYREGVVIDKPVEIVGDGELGEVVIEASGKTTVLFQANMGRIINLTLRQTGGGNYACVHIAQGRLDLEGCDIASRGVACVAIHGGADPRLRRNRIHDGNDTGVMVYKNGQGTLEDNDIFANTLAGVEITTGSNPTLRRNRIHDGESAGVFVHENGRGTLEDNDIFGNVLAGVGIATGGDPKVRRNRIRDGKAGGVFVYDNGRGTIEDNDITANKFAGVEIQTGGNPLLRWNRIHDGKAGGVFVDKNGQGTLYDNEIFANAKTGVEIETGGNPSVLRNRITKNGYKGVWIRSGSQGTFEDNDLRGNTHGAWDIAAGCIDKVKRARNQEE
jgi:F-box protein 11